MEKLGILPVGHGLKTAPIPRNTTEGDLILKFSGSSYTRSGPNLSHALQNLAEFEEKTSVEDVELLCCYCSLSPRMGAVIRR